MRTDIGGRATRAERIHRRSADAIELHRLTLGSVENGDRTVEHCSYAVANRHRFVRVPEKLARPKVHLTTVARSADGRGSSPDARYT